MLASCWRCRKKGAPGCKNGDVCGLKTGPLKPPLKLLVWPSAAGSLIRGPGLDLDGSVLRNPWARAPSGRHKTKPSAANASLASFVIGKLVIMVSLRKRQVGGPSLAGW